MLYRRLLFVGTILLITVIFSGCNGKPKLDVSIFMMTQRGVTTHTADLMRTALQAKVGDQFTVGLDNSVTYSLEKLVLEIAGGKHDIFIIPKERFLAMAGPNRYVELDAYFEQADYPGGILEITEDATTEKHLYGVPIGKSDWFAQVGLLQNDEYAFIPGNAKHKADAKKVLQILMK